MALIYVAVGLGLAVLFILIMAGSNPEPPPENVTDDDIRELAKSGEKIKAIKWYRGLHGADLKSAKEAVEAMMDSV
jgi:ribosomal protein L7/L12